MTGEAGSYNRSVGGYVLRKHVDLTDTYIEQRLAKEKRASVSFFTSKKDAERIIHTALIDNSDKIDEWLVSAGTGAKLDMEGYISGKGAFVIESADRQRKSARHIRVTIVREEYNGMAYYIHTVKLYQ
ncbi:RNase A-like domain-containing protein [Acidomonas methanolica]|uniref:RNase A-like domain-containing protein n=1 Tax=Acidomonas methanolica TaxID=437 RepID=UPI002119EF7E|nr:RNase A-like domain-containing protein [Acidomonas methanolica]MCQ9156936.1 hypothetical protein [Acidomonas methanolica]